MVKKSNISKIRFKITALLKKIEVNMHSVLPCKHINKKKQSTLAIKISQQD